MKTRLGYIERGACQISLLVLFWLTITPAGAEICVDDDLGNTICLAEPAQRIAALSPGATELAYSAGAGQQVVAVVSFSDFPPEARQVQSVGSHTRMDIELLVTLKPDLVIGWLTGNPREQLESLESLGMPVFYLEPRDFEGIASAVERLARLAGTEVVGTKVAGEFRAGMDELATTYADVDPVTVFYQVWDEPLMTVNDQHLIGKVLNLCGGSNPFGELPRLVPRIGLESVLAVDPEAIVAGGMGEENRDWLDNWERYPQIEAVHRNNLFFVPPSLIQRPTPRLLQGSRIFCEKLDEARARR